MKTEKNKGKVFQVNCPVCRNVLWIDAVAHEVIKTERGKKVKGSLDDLLVKERERKEEHHRKFEATSELQEERRKKAQKIFESAFTKVEKK